MMEPKHTKDRAGDSRSHAVRRRPGRRPPTAERLDCAAAGISSNRQGNYPLV